MGKRKRTSSPDRNNLGEDEFHVEAILAARIDEDEHWEYRIRWYGYDEAEDTWEPQENLVHCADMMASFFAQFPGDPDFEVGEVYSPSKKFIDNQIRETRELMDKRSQKKKDSKRRKLALDKRAESTHPQLSSSSRASSARREVATESLPLSPPTPMKKGGLREVLNLDFQAAGKNNLIPDLLQSRGRRTRGKVYPVSAPEAVSSSAEAESSDDEPLASQTLSKRVRSRLRKDSAVLLSASPTSQRDSPEPTSRAASPDQSLSPLFSGSMSPINTTANNDLPDGMPEDPIPELKQMHPTLAPSTINAPLIRDPATETAQVLSQSAPITASTSSSAATAHLPRNVNANPTPAPKPILKTSVPKTRIGLLEGITTKQRIASATSAMSPIALGRKPQVATRSKAPVPSSSSLDKAGKAMIEGIFNPKPSTTPTSRPPLPPVQTSNLSSGSRGPASTSGRHISFASPATPKDSYPSTSQLDIDDGFATEPPTNSPSTPLSAAPLPEKNGGITDPRLRAKTAISVWNHDCNLHISNKFSCKVRLADKALTTSVHPSGMNLDLAVRLNQELRFQNTYSVFYTPLLLQSFRVGEMTRVTDQGGDGTQSFIPLTQWLSNSSRVTIAPLNLPTGDAGEHGCYLLFSPTTHLLCEKLKVPSALRIAGSLILVFLHPRFWPKFTAPYFLAPSCETDRFGIPVDILAVLKDKSCAFAPHPKSKIQTTYNYALKQNLFRKYGVKEEDGYQGHPRCHLIQFGTRPERIAGLTHRRLRYPDFQFILYSKTALLPAGEQTTREVWSIGAVVSYTARAIAENPFGFREQVRWLTKQPFCEAYVNPLTVAFLAKGLNLIENVTNGITAVALEMVLELLQEGSLSLTSCPPSKELIEESEDWVEDNLTICNCILHDLISKQADNGPELSSRLTEAGQSLLALCQKQLITYNPEDESDLNRELEDDLSRLQMTPVGLSRWRRYILVLDEGVKAGSTQVVDAKNGVERARVEKLQLQLRKGRVEGDWT